MAWRNTNVEPIQPDINKAEKWHDSHVNEPLRRRRPGRKRKRRPQLSPTEDFDPPETFIQQGSMSLQEEVAHTTEEPKRRRKKIDEHQESDPSRIYNQRDENVEGLQRRRKGHRRKRPIVHSWPEMIEPDYQRHDQVKVHEEISNENNSPYSNNFHESIETDRMEVKIEDKNYNDKNKESIEIINHSHFENNKFHTETPYVKHYESEITTEKVEDIEKPDSNVLKTNKDTRASEVSEQNRRLDPLTLKALLKKSNGRSLSEILQQNNLSLSDLLSGKEQAVSILKVEDSAQNQDQDSTKEAQGKQIFNLEQSSEESINKSKDNIIFNKEKKLEPNLVETTTEPKYFHENRKDHTEEKEVNDKSNLNSNGISGSVTIRRRFPAVRRKLRMRPTLSNSYKAQLSRDLITLSSIKYQNNRNSTRFRNFKDLMTSKLDRTEPSVIDTTEAEVETTTFIPDEMVTTMDDQLDELTTITFLKDSNVVNENDEIETLHTADSKTPIVSQTDCENKETTTLIFELEPESFFTTTTESPKENYSIKPASTLRRQTFDNRLKRKRMKQRFSTEAPGDYEIKDVFNIANLVPASEFIAKTKTTAADDENDFTTLEDFLTTEPSFETRRKNKSRKRNFNRKFGVSSTQKPISTTEVTAKIEIQEILNDTSTSERLSRILKERNMTLLELVEQRERGSSHVHLADIFHNASKEPNPPEPFLSKSLIEPISKETYPLRALLEANQYDPKATTIDSITGQSNSLNKPIVLDFGNNVNENSENMGIISLFQNITKNHISEQTKNDMANKTNELQVSNINTSHERDLREGRALDADKALITWNEIINFMKNKEKNETIATTTPKIEDENPITEKNNKYKTNEDSIDERLGMFEDLQYLTNHLDRQIVPLSKNDDNLNIYEENENVEVLDAVDSSYMSTTKSVTVATACIIGLSLVLFLLTYTILKWKQDAKILRNNSCRKTNDIPTPVFENRKGQKINSSTRSKSPMLSNSNIYAIDSLDTHKGNDSPEYMWDSLRKPFQ